jgi:hypothetical protein
MVFCPCYCCAWGKLRATLSKAGWDPAKKKPGALGAPGFSFLCLPSVSRQAFAISFYRITVLQAVIEGSL